MPRRRKAPKPQPRVRTNTMLADLQDGDICLLECGCQIQRMMDHPREWNMVNSRILGFCESGEPGRAIALSADIFPCSIATNRKHRLTPNCWTVNVSKHTPVAHDRLASDLVERFG